MKMQLDEALAPYRNVHMTFFPVFPTSFTTTQMEISVHNIQQSIPYEFCVGKKSVTSVPGANTTARFSGDITKRTTGDGLNPRLKTQNGVACILFPSGWLSLGAYTVTGATFETMIFALTTWCAGHMASHQAARPKIGNVVMRVDYECCFRLQDLGYDAYIKKMWTTFPGEFFSARIRNVNDISHLPQWEQRIAHLFPYPHPDALNYMPKSFNIGEDIRVILAPKKLKVPKAVTFCVFESTGVGTAIGACYDSTRVEILDYMRYIVKDRFGHLDLERQLRMTGHERNNTRKRKRANESMEMLRACDEVQPDE